MNATEAKEALALLNSVVSKTRDDSAMQNWGMIWMFHGVTNAIGFIVTQHLMKISTYDMLLFYCGGMWLSILAFNFIVIALLRRKHQGTSTFVEKQIWSIWLTFLVLVIFVAAVNVLRDMPPFELLPVVALLGSFALSMMGALIGKIYYSTAVGFAGVALLMCFFHEYQLILFGLVWGVCQFGMGFHLHRQKLRLAEGPQIV